MKEQGLYLVFGLSCIAYIWVETSMPIIRIIFSIPHDKRLKPLDCAPCLAFWLTLILSSFNPFEACIAYVTASLITRAML